MSVKRPLVGVPADRRNLGSQAYHVVGEKYLTAALQGAGVTPVIVPVLDGEFADSGIVDAVDGWLFTGSPSNVEPHHYRGEPSIVGTMHDPHRDAATLPLIPRAIAAGVPVLGICRGFQEMNVAFGGTLWQRLWEVPGLMDHRENKDHPSEQQYAAVHEVSLAPGGVLRRLAGGADRLQVNSLHGQGVRELGAGLTIEARASDGVIEAFRVTAAKTFALAVQWHPEWRVLDNKFSTALFAEFGAACRGQA